MLSRRDFLTGTCGGIVLAAGTLPAAEKKSLKGEVGVTTGSFMRHLSPTAKPGKLRLLDLPRLMRDELDMRVIDLMTRTLASMKPDYLENLRKNAEQAGCVLTNLKMNQPNLEIASPEKDKREHALAEYKRTIDVAARLGCRWVRPLPGAKRPDFDRLVAGYRELIDYAAPKKISLLFENFGWISSDPDVLPKFIKAVGEGIAASPDTGNWTDKVRYEGLAKAFPLAVTCDFKAFMLGPGGAHPKYDLKKCFEVGWKAGFRGPWCLEHFNETLPGLLAGMKTLRGMLKQWMREAAKG